MSDYKKARLYTALMQILSLRPFEITELDNGFIAWVSASLDTASFSGVSVEIESGFGERMENYKITVTV